jgi:hypothetical protein
MFSKRIGRNKYKPCTGIDNQATAVHTQLFCNAHAFMADFLNNIDPATKMKQLLFL